MHPLYKHKTPPHGIHARTAVFSVMSGYLLNRRQNTISSIEIGFDTRGHICRRTVAVPVNAGSEAFVGNVQLTQTG